MSDYDLDGYHNPKRPRDPKAVRTQSPLPEVLRKFCYQCWKAGDLCLCQDIVQVDNPLEIGLVFHPRERKNPINTGRLAFLSLKNTWAATGVEFDQIKEYQSAMSKYQPGEVGVLYPSQDAVDLSEAPSELKCLIVVDGTWNEAKKMIHRTPSLKSLPHYAFTPEKESNYRIRKEPAPHCVSTIEAVVTCLKAYDLGQGKPDSQAYQPLLDVFDKMVDNQLRCKAEKGHSRHKERQDRAEEAWRQGALNWLYLSMHEEQRDYIENHLGEEQYLAKLKELKTPESVVEWIQSQQA